jgi:hypothetical protein
LVANYHSWFKQKAIATQLLQKVRELEGLVAYPASESLIKKYEEVDKLRCKIVEYVESKFRKLKMGQVAFSRKVGDAGRVISAWIIILKSKSRQISSRLISRLVKKAGLPSDVRALNTEEVTAKLKEAHEKYYALKANSKQL